MDRNLVLTRALDECIAEGILAEFLVKNKEEIKTMFNTRWNMEDAMRVLGNECREEGFMEGEARGRVEASNDFVSSMLKAQEPVAKIIQYTQLPLEKIQELATSLGLALVV